MMTVNTLADGKQLLKAWAYSQNALQLCVASTHSISVCQSLHTEYVANLSSLDLGTSTLGVCFRRCKAEAAVHPMPFSKALECTAASALQVPAERSSTLYCDHYEL